MRRSLFVSALGLTTSLSLLLATRRAAAFALPAIPFFHSSRGWTSVIPVRDQSATARAHKSSRKGGQYSVREGQEHRTSTRPRARETEVEPAARIQRDYPHVVLRAGKARLFLEGNPLVYGEAVHEVVGHVADGDFVEVVDHRGNLIGKGCYNSQSMYRVRLLWHAREKGEALYASSLEDIVARRVSTAWATRQALGLPNAETTCFRLVNGEGDKLSGLAADVFDKVCVVSSSSLWCERHKDFIIQGLEASLGPAGISTVWRRSEARLKQDGFVDPEEALRPAIDVKAEARKEGAYVWAKEAGLKYKVYPELGQKTGFYCDQRQNRQMIQSLSRGKRVLDLFCYTGGFALNAARGGAREAIGVDSSALAIETAMENARANDLEGHATFCKSDVLVYARDLGKTGEKAFDIVIADPPKLAPTRRDLPRALHKYLKINRAVFRMVASGGLVLTHTCSAALTQDPEEFRKMVTQAAHDVGRSITILQVSHAAPCHVQSPVYGESNYLTAMLVAVF
ncbi:ribosomal rna large subunit methyltransferase i [Nannochloropsis gaditana]|uniref:Ribosomal rna large subunit methyltransferase i n=1 Tax=Nannochloropsis gaditana TaxID=72520 RepID=W7TTY6_9STRA|nr:ribosomal rna large subunit methyltransferase i [Nannochloropsis gaditana]